MSESIVKGVKRSPSRPASRHNSPTSSAKNRTLAGKSSRPKPLVKRSASDKAPARKATKSSAKSSSAALTKSKTAKGAPARKTTTSRKAAAPAKAKTISRKAAPVKATKKQALARPAAKSRSVPTKKAASANLRKPSAPPPPPRQPTQDEAAALRTFERAHKEFARGRFGEARNQFRALLEKHSGVSEVAARARTYLAIAEARLRTESTLPRDADSLYDRGVIELNRGEYVAAQEMFERALKREPVAAHIHYGLAATRSRLGSIDMALESLQRALDLQPSLRLRAQHDQDLALLRNDPEFERLVFSTRP